MAILGHLIFFARIRILSQIHPLEVSTPRLDTAIHSRARICIPHKMLFFVSPSCLFFISLARSLLLYLTIHQISTMTHWPHLSWWHWTSDPIMGGVNNFGMLGSKRWLLGIR
jgi:hypothetical protein